MPFDRGLLPEPIAYFESEGVPLVGPGKWMTGPCLEHGGSDSTRVHRETGAWVCMSCGVKGGDVLSFHMQRHGLDFVSAAKALGAWVEHGRGSYRQAPLPLSARAGLEVVSFECLLVATAACNLARGIELQTNDRDRLVEAASRIRFIAEEVTR